MELSPSMTLEGKTLRLVTSDKNCHSVVTIYEHYASNHY